MTAAAGAEFVAGLAGVVLGILALTGLAPWSLTPTALLCVAAAVALGGATISGRMLALLRR